jgi:hypothetical protein
LAFSYWGTAAAGIQTDMKGYCQWTTFLFIYSSFNEWDSWSNYHTQERVASRWPPLTYDFYLGYGCSGVFDQQGKEWGATTTYLHKDTTTSGVLLRWWCGIISATNKWENFHHYGYSTRIWGGFWAAQQCAEEQCLPHSVQWWEKSGAAAIAMWNVGLPMRYLGLPLSLKKLTRDQLQPIIDRIAGQLPGWKADLLTKPGRRILVQFVLTGMLIYLAMAIDLLTWCLKDRQDSAWFLLARS